MNNENMDILIAARKENKGKEYEDRASIRGSMLGGVVAIFLGLTLFLLEYCVKGTVNIGLIAIGMTASSVQSLYEGIKTKRIWMIVSGIIQGLVALFAIIAFILQTVV